MIDVVMYNIHVSHFNGLNHHSTYSPLFVPFLFDVPLQKEMVKRRFGAYSGMCASDLTVIATEYTPVLKWLGFRAVQGYKEEDNVETISFDGQETEISDDEIEEW